MLLLTPFMPDNIILSLLCTAGSWGHRIGISCDKAIWLYKGNLAQRLSDGRIMQKHLSI